MEIDGCIRGEEINRVMTEFTNLMMTLAMMGNESLLVGVANYADSVLGRAYQVLKHHQAGGWS